MNIDALDLNLLRVLQVVLTEKSATRAAQRLHVTQSAISNALGRLREVLDDPLFVRNARGLTPTPRALELQPELDALMRSMRELLNGPDRFDPKTTSREFKVACADYCITILGTELSVLLVERAPGARLSFVTLEQLSSGEGLASDIDLHLGMPPRIPSGCRSSPLFDDRFVCMRKKSTRPSSRGLSLKEYLNAAHVRVSVLGSESDAVDRALAARRFKRNIALTVPHFSVLPPIVQHTGYIATLSRRLAETQARWFDITLCEPPIDLGERSTRMVWHERTDADPGARFLRQLVQEAAQRALPRAAR